jgi:hypothetical protein
MTRTMGDAISANVTALETAGVQMVAGYVTGTPDIAWTAADWALFSSLPQVTIDQGNTAYGSPVASADVRDVESGAWTPTSAVVLAGWTAARPTIYCSLDVLPQVESAGWQGDVWVAYYTSAAPSTPPAVPAGMTCVAVQWTDTGGGGTYDLSAVFDPWWPDLPPQEGEGVQAYQYSDGRQGVALIATNGQIWVTEQSSPGSGWTATATVGGAVPVNPVSLAVQVVSDVPSLFIQSADPASSGNGDVWTSWKPVGGSWAAWVQIT